MTDIDTLCTALSYMSVADIQAAHKAYHFADAAHCGQVRKSGEPYIIHPIRVAIILAELEPDIETILAAILHDVIEDTPITAEEMCEQFGSVVTGIVEGVSKLASIKADNYQQTQAENFQKMALAMTKDIRVILVKIVDRYHNMLTIQHLPKAKQKRIAQETLQVYAPIANRLGMDDYFRKLQDLCFKTLYPMRFNMISRAVQAARKRRQYLVEEVKQVFEQMLQVSGITGKVEGREKHLAGIYFKMSGGNNDPADPYRALDRVKRVSFQNIMDVHGFRIITDNVDHCYVLLGQVHRVFKPYPNRFKDYIAMPKVNGYQSLHTTVMEAQGHPIEVQIRTNEMDRLAKTGLASHWLYKSNQDGKDVTTSDEPTLFSRWKQSLITMQSESSSSREFLDNVRLDLFPNDVYVFSPRGDIFPLPKGSTSVDFAYAVHTDVGNRCVGCEINGEAAPLSTKLVNGDTVKVETRNGAKPNPQWRDFVVTAKALSGMGYYFRNLRQSEAVRLGQQLLDNALLQYGVSLTGIRNELVDTFLHSEGYVTLDEVLERLGTGKLFPGRVAQQLHESTSPPNKDGIEPMIITDDNASVLTFARCCRPVCGDTVTALVRSDAGIVIHRTGCSNIRRLRRDMRQTLPASWSEGVKITLPVPLRLEVTNNPELLGAIADSIAALGCRVQSMENTDRDIHIQVLLFIVMVDHRYHLSSLLRRLRKLADVKRVNRV